MAPSKDRLWLFLEFLDVILFLNLKRIEYQEKVSDEEKLFNFSVGLYGYNFWV
tara:strand:+ start:3366 stop:3524 length:159 start_codon:yes stop_codon:yes gene_type:complete